MPKQKTTLDIIMALSDEEFNKFFSSLPTRVQLMAKSGLIDWTVVLPKWYEKLILNK